jgi:hypothetical protein
MHRVVTGSSLFLAMMLAGLAAASGPVHLKRVAVVDPAYGLDAHFFLIPADWTMESQISYNPAPSLSLNSVVHIHDRPGLTGVLMLGGESAYAWGSGPVWDMFVNGGAGNGMYQGRRVLAPLSPEEYLRQICLPTFQRLYPGFRLIEVRPDPQTVALYQLSQRALGLQTAMAGAGVRMEYQAVAFKGSDRRGGQPVEMEGTLLLTYGYASGDGVNTSCTWGLTALRLYYAGQGRLVSTLPLLRSIVRNGRINPRWYIRMQNHRLQVWQIARDAQAEVGRMLERMNESVRDRDRIYAGFSEYIRGTSVYQNPENGNYYELENGYNKVWFGSGGDVIYTDNDNYSPNTDPRFNNQSWAEGRPSR